METIIIHHTNTHSKYVSGSSFHFAKLDCIPPLCDCKIVYNGKQSLNIPCHVPIPRGDKHNNIHRTITGLQNRKRKMERRALNKWNTFRISVGAFLHRTKADKLWLINLVSKDFYFHLQALLFEIWPNKITPNKNSIRSINLLKWGPRRNP